MFNDLGDDPNLDARDFFTFKVPKNRELVSIMLNKYDNSSYGDNTGAGASIADLADPSALIGGNLIGVADGLMQGDELMADLQKGFSFGEMNVPALEPGAMSGGDLTFCFQEGNQGAENLQFVDYSMTFTFDLIASSSFKIALLWL
ncbi:hypothetical protein [Synechococcus sp. MIT S1220]|uniref:hypothetical protein n=1 Tax=Synechococcus sp. MIT S1220 TaxID=3082549 RepID=UPI0039AFD881